VTHHLSAVGGPQIAWDLVDSLKEGWRPVWLTTDAIVIGAGQPGPGVAGALVEDGKRVALIEMDRAGGTCLNHGCKPTKALRASASVAHQARRAAAYVNTSEVTVDFAAAMSRVRSIIDGLRDSLDDWLAGVDGLDLLHGTATVVTDVAANSIRWPSTASI